MEQYAIEAIDDNTWQEFLASPLSLLVVTVSTCPACAQWESELEAWMVENTRWAEARAGKIVLDSPKTTSFKRDNEWLDNVPGLPFTAVFVNGEPRASLAGGGLSRLERRLEGLGLPLESSEWSPAVAQPTQTSGAKVPTTATETH